jgi:hypothetical protein
MMFLIVAGSVMALFPMPPDQFEERTREIGNESFVLRHEDRDLHQLIKTYQDEEARLSLRKVE